MEALQHAISIGIARRIAQVITHRLTFSHGPGGVLIVTPPVQKGGLLSGVAAGFGASSGELIGRYFLCPTTQLHQESRHVYRPTKKKISLYDRVCT